MNSWTLLFDLDDDDQEDAHQNERIRQRWSAEIKKVRLTFKVS
jgi:hypothetical protein